jgi:hypothetical protein
MSLRRTAGVLALLVLVLPGWLAAQGLGDAAAAARAKRAKQAGAKKTDETRVFTNDDLAKGRPPGAQPTGSESPASATPAEGEGGSSEEPPAVEDRFADERPLLDALTAAQSRVSTIEARIQELRSKLNPMSGSFIYGAFGSNSANEEAAVRSELQQLETDLTDARREVAAATEALARARRGRPQG